ncbi:hypothetical protein LXL04_019365 [Taraxacum kok-saghyz]
MTDRECYPKCPTVITLSLLRYFVPVSPLQQQSEQPSPTVKKSLRRRCLPPPLLPSSVDRGTIFISNCASSASGSFTRSRRLQIRLFLSGSKDGGVKLWDAKKARLVYQWPKLPDRYTFLQLAHLVYN